MTSSTRDEPSPIKAVLDSNVIISALAFRAGKPRELLDLVRAGEIHVWISPFMLMEIARSLRGDFGWSEPLVQDALATLQTTTTVIDPQPVTTVVTADPADNRVLDCALEGQVQFLITGDRRHLLPLRVYQGISIVSPSEFLALLQR